MILARRSLIGLERQLVSINLKTFLRRGTLATLLEALKN